MQVQSTRLITRELVLTGSTWTESSIINVQTSSGDTPLHWLLLTARERASIESKEDTEKMPLSKAAEASVVKLTKALLGAGTWERVGSGEWILMSLFRD